MYLSIYLYVILLNGLAGMGESVGWFGLVWFGATLYSASSKEKINTDLL